MFSSRPPKRTGSGEHPVVQTFRQKLASVDESTGAALSELDRSLEEFLHEVKTPQPAAIQEAPPIHPRRRDRRRG
jgi:hypothetical protein